MTEDEFKHGLEEEWRNGYRVGRLEEREKLAQWMIRRGYATGHGDTVEDLLKELELQLAENWTNSVMKVAAAEREACANLCDEIDTQAWKEYKDSGKSKPHEEGVSDGANACAVAIRARGEK